MPRESEGSQEFDDSVQGISAERAKQLESLNDGPLSAFLSGLEEERFSALMASLKDNNLTIKELSLLQDSPDALEALEQIESEPDADKRAVTAEVLHELIG